MQSPAKIQLSTLELELVNNTEWILTKNGIIEKVKKLLHDIQMAQHEVLMAGQDQLPAEVLMPSPKISRGENYKGLPYLILDNPRFFDRQNIFAIRTMFWWGHFFSITLHVSGSYKNMLAKKFLDGDNKLFESDFYYCVNEDEWEHHFGSGNYMPLKELKKEEILKLMKENTFIKMAQKIPLQQWEEAEEMLLTYFKKLIAIAAD